MFDPEKPPEFTTARWFNTAAPPTLAGLKGKVVVLSAFQLQCKGSMTHGLPQAMRLAGAFSDDEVQVLGLHVPFEQHDKETPDALEAFLGENEFEFPIGIDKPNGNGIPKTMEAFEIRGTPTVLVFDRQGRLRRHYLGQVDDVRLGAEIMALAIEARDAPREQSIALERRLAAALVDPNEHHHHHDGECCGGHDHTHDHDHAHGHSHDADHEHAGGCCGGAHAHSHANDDHAHDYKHTHTHEKDEGCGDPGCGCKH
jgi:hypothetical protein